MRIGIGRINNSKKNKIYLTLNNRVTNKTKIVYLPLNNFMEHQSLKNLNCLLWSLPGCRLLTNNKNINRAFLTWILMKMNKNKKIKVQKLPLACLEIIWVPLLSKVLMKLKRIKSLFTKIYCQEKVYNKNKKNNSISLVLVTAYLKKINNNF